ncbi:hypothetical protein [Gordonia polyisoprenivorans]|uniref:hypothetical protein n=1 Tax=Gordonia polyisoprenivorans TaxID=84595 RepID=UPI0012DCF8BB|nr:hypothetical protein [Gordonia polyisoprenivorans]
MFRRDHAPQASSGKEGAPPTEGYFQSIDHIANWVRFADTKATILTAGLGVVITMTMSKTDTIVQATHQGTPQACLVACLGTLTVASFLYTLAWLCVAIGPRSGIGYKELNRFAWPSLVNATPDQLRKHASSISAQDDAWRQAIDLSDLAQRKFGACGNAVRGFAVFVVLAVVTVIVASALR